MDVFLPVRNAAPPVSVRSCGPVVRAERFEMPPGPDPASFGRAVVRPRRAGERVRDFMVPACDRSEILVLVGTSVPFPACSQRGAARSPLVRSGTRWNAQERSGTPWNAQERAGTPKNDLERPGIPRNGQERPGTLWYAQERPGTPGTPRSALERFGTPSNAMERPGTPCNALERPGTLWFGTTRHKS